MEITTDKQKNTLGWRITGGERWSHTVIAGLYTFCQALGMVLQMDTVYDSTTKGDYTIILKAKVVKVCSAESPSRFIGIMHSEYE